MRSTFRCSTERWATNVVTRITHAPIRAYSVRTHGQGDVSCSGRRTATMTASPPVVMTYEVASSVQFPQERPGTRCGLTAVLEIAIGPPRRVPHTFHRAVHTLSP